MNPELKNLVCTKCGASIDKQDVNDAVIICSHCGNSFLLHSDKENATNSIFSIPENITIDKTYNSFTLLYKWSVIKHAAILGFSIFWVSFSVFWTYMASQGGGFFFIFGTFFIMIGIAMFYYGLAGIFNKTIIQIENGLLTVNFKPFFWFGKKKIETKDIIQFYTKEKITSTKKGTTKTYNLIAIFNDNRNQKIISDIDSPEIVKYIEQQLESYLKIKNISVTDEFRF